MTGLSLRALRIQHASLDVSLNLEAGELVLLSGPSGAGKTLLLRAVADLDPHQGEVWLGELACSLLVPAEWRRQVGLLTAESGWWEDCVGAHFSALHGKSGLAPLLAALGFALETLDWPVARLSTGERQRLALARLLANQPRALLLDEPTANLDPANRDRVERLILSYQRQHQAPVLWVSHDQDQRRRLSAQCAARRLWIADGALVDEP